MIQTFFWFATPAGFISVIGVLFSDALIIKTGVKHHSMDAIVTGVLYIIFGFVTTPIGYFIILTLFHIYCSGIWHDRNIYLDEQLVPT